MKKIQLPTQTHTQTYVLDHKRKQKKEERHISSKLFQ
jgi:hypothetical protein